MSESYWQKLLREAEERRRVRLNAERLEAAKKALDDVPQSHLYAMCPCCQGKGVLAVIFGARDDA